MRLFSLSMGVLCAVLALTACQPEAVAPVAVRPNPLVSGVVAPTAGQAEDTPTAGQPESAPTAQPTETSAPSQPTANPSAVAATAQAATNQVNSAANPATASSGKAATPGQTSAGQAGSTLKSPSATPQNCRNIASFYGDITVPDGTFFRAGDSFTKTWRFRNSGECTWTPEYSVVFYAGEMMNAPLAVPFPTTVAPGEQVDISIPMQAPGRGGGHTGNWEFVDPSGRHFAAGFTGNDRFWVSINVSFVDSQGAAIPMGPSASTGFVPGASAAIPAGCAGKQDRSVETQVIALINQARQQNGLPPLRENSQADAAALSHSADMACKNFLNHTGSDGSTWYDRLRAQGYAYNDARENIYAGEPGYGGDPQGAFDWWMNSQVHRDNILNPESTEIGVGYVANPQSQYGGYFTVVFTRP
jgi:uncharacterized protein YkwD